MIGFTVGLILLAVVLAVAIGLGVEDQRANTAKPASDACTTSTGRRSRLGRIVEKVGQWLPPMIP